MISAVVADAMRRAGEQVPADGIISLSNGVPIACGAGPDPTALPDFRAVQDVVTKIDQSLGQASLLFDKLTSLLNDPADRQQSLDAKKALRVLRNQIQEKFSA